MVAILENGCQFCHRSNLRWPYSQISPRRYILTVCQISCFYHQTHNHFTYLLHYLTGRPIQFMIITLIVDPSSSLPLWSGSLDRLQNSDNYYCHLHRNVNLHYSRTFLPLCTSSPSPFSSSLPKGSVRLLHLGSLTLSVGLVT